MRLAEEKYLWTAHARMKMRYYRLTESRVKRIIRYPARVEEGIFHGAIACMQPAGGKQHAEIWTFYTLSGNKGSKKKIKIISAWRYPGRSPAHDPIPAEVMKEIRSLV